MGFQRLTDKIYIAPVVFGPALCQLQDINGKRYEGVIETVDKFSIIYEVQFDKLLDLLPSGFELVEPIMLINVEILSNIAWLAGRGLARIEVQTPVVCKGISGLFNMVTWENNGDSIICGRDIFGTPKIYARITHSYEGTVFKTTAASWEFSFLDLRVDEAKPPDDINVCEKFLQQKGFHRVIKLNYLPMTGEGFTKTDACYTTSVPTDQITNIPQFCSGSVHWFSPQFEDMPTQYRIAHALAELLPKRSIGAWHISFNRIASEVNQKILE